MTILFVSTTRNILFKNHIMCKIYGFFFYICLHFYSRYKYLEVKFRRLWDLESLNLRFGSSECPEPGSGGVNGMDEV